MTRIVVGSHCAASEYLQVGPGLLWHTIDERTENGVHNFARAKCGLFFVLNDTVTTTFDKPSFGDCLNCLRYA